MPGVARQFYVFLGIPAPEGSGMGLRSSRITPQIAGLISFASRLWPGLRHCRPEESDQHKYANGADYLVQTCAGDCSL